MSKDTDFFNTKYPDHKCGTVLDYCIYNDTKIFFCIYCKKVTGAAKEPEIRITLSIADDIGMKEYDTETLEELK